MADQTPPTELSFSQKLSAWFHTRRAKHVGLGIVGFVALYAIFGFLIAPSLIKDTAEEQLTAQLKRPTSIREVVLNPFTLRLQVDDIHIGGKEDKEDFVDIGQFVVRVSWASVVKFTPVIAEFTITRPRLHIVRNDATHFNFSDLLESSPDEAKSPKTEKAKPEAEDEKSGSFNLILDRFLIADGGLKFTDKSEPEVFTETLSDLTLGVNDISITGDDLSAIKFATNLENGGKIGVEGNFNVASGWAETKLSIERLAVSSVQPYLAKATTAQIRDGLFGAVLQARADWSQGPFNLVLKDSALSLKNLQIAKPEAEVAAISLADFGVQISKVDLASQSAEIARVNITDLFVDAVRQKDGVIDLLGLMVPAKVSEKPQPQPSEKQAEPVAATPPAEEEAAPWRYHIAEIALENAQAALVDHTTPNPAKLSIAPLNITLRDVDQDLSTAFPVALDAVLNDKGTVTVAGDVAVSPLDVKLHINGDRLDLAPFGPYVQTAVNAKLASAFFNANGDVAVKQAGDNQQVSYAGDLALVDVQMLDQVSADAFAGWKTFALNGLKATFDAQKGVDVDTKQVLFSNFHGHVLLDKQGRLHLQDVVAKDQDETKTGSTKPKPTKAQKPAPKTKAKTAVASEKSDAMPMRLHFGQLKLRNGRVVYTDNFIRPNYKAKLEAISGTVGAFGTHSKKSAPVDIKARLAANGPIAIKGKVNPLATPPSLDMTASARGIELTNLAAYSTKYVGYPIRKGKLNVGLSYKLANDKLEANNHIFINQLTFGEHVKNDTATSLPVLFAINLMTDAKGQIDINIPVSGSLDDPEFSVGGLIWKAIGNLITKAITAPFSLLASAFGVSGEELDYVQFEPGSAVLTAGAQQKLDTLVKMLASRPSINLSLTGYVNPGEDEPALRSAYVQQQVLKQKLGDVVGKGRSVDMSKIKLTPEEYAEYLEDAYGDAEFERPRNAFGLLKDQPVDVMEKAMYDNAPIDVSSLKQLGLGRTQAVREYLKGKVEEARIFTETPADDAPEDAQTTRVNFKLQ